MKQFAKKNWICGQTTRGFCTTITHRRIMTSLSVSIWLKTNTIQQPPNSPNLAPCDFFLFGRLKEPLRGTRYRTRDEVMEKSKMALMAILALAHQLAIGQFGQTVLTNLEISGDLEPIGI